VRESIEHLTGDARDARLLEVTLALSAELLVLGGLYGDLSDARAAARDALESGRAAERFAAMVVELGGPAGLLEAPSLHLPGASVVRPIEPDTPGVVSAIDVRAVGIAIVNLGGGRAREDDRVDHAVGLTEVAALGERVEAGGRPLALVHARDDDSARRAAAAIRSAFALGDPPADIPGPVAEVQRAV
jgi:thymidine phosphorylase